MSLKFMDSPFVSNLAIGISNSIVRHNVDLEDCFTALLYNFHHFECNSDPYAWAVESYILRWDVRVKSSKGLEVICAIKITPTRFVRFRLLLHNEKTTKRRLRGFEKSPVFCSDRSLRTIRVIFIRGRLLLCISYGEYRYGGAEWERVRTSDELSR